MKKAKVNRQRPMLMQEIADLAGVSKSTVSRALAGSPLLAEQTRDSIVRLAREHGYRLNKKARTFQSSSTLTIAVVVSEPGPTEWSFTDPFFLQLLGRIANELDKRGHELLLANIRIDIDEWIDRHIVRGNCDGAIVIGQGHSHEQINALGEVPAPIVVWGGRLDDQRYCTVGSDNRHGGYLATKHLIDQGRSRVGFVGQRQMPELGLRYDGYLDAHDEAGLAPEAALTVDTGVSSSVAESDFGALLERTTDIDAVAAASDVVALGVMRAILTSGRRIPDDIAVVGYDDIAIARTMSPSLSTIRQDYSLGAKYLVDKLLRAVDGAGVRPKMLRPELIVRESSDPEPRAPGR